MLNHPKDGGNKYTYRAAVITASDKGYRGEREDESGVLLCRIMIEHGYCVTCHKILPDEQSMLEEEMRRLADENIADIILTTGGTGFSTRDRTPEATLAIADRMVPGIAEAMRFLGMNKTKRAMLSRAVSVIRKQTLIINLPGSPRAVRENLDFIIDELEHALDILCGNVFECAR